MERSGKAFKDVDAVAVTFGPGLPGSLMVGLSAAKAISFALMKPLIGVNHLEGHIYANFLSSPRFANAQHPSPSMMERGRRACEPGVRFPFICLIVSGGHTQIVLVKDHCEYETLGRTRDDAAGEAFDKIARFLGLGYPGGPIIDKLAKEGNPKAVNFKRPMIEDEFGYDFSFSGIKTAVVYYVKKSSPRFADAQHPSPSMMERGRRACEPGVRIADLVASFQLAVVETLVEKTLRAAKEKNVKTVALAGGVSANSLLRKMLKEVCEKENIACVIPPVEFCTDNAAMIGCAGYFRSKKGFISDYSLAIQSTAKL